LRYVFFYSLFFHFLLFKNCHRINKFGSQKDQEQKKSGNYFFYDDAETDDAADADFDDI